MAQYHISKSGKPALCKAKSGSCPLGSDSPHYENKAEAQHATEQMSAEEYNIKNSISKSESIDTDKPKKLSARERIKAKQAAKQADYADFVTESLKINEIHAKLISKDDKSMTFETDIDKRITIKTETTYDMNFKAMENYTVELYEMKDNKPELVGREESSNKFKVTETAIKFNQDF